MKCITRVAIGFIFFVLAGCASAPTQKPASESEEPSVQVPATTLRAVQIRYAPSFAAPIVGTAPADSALYWLDKQQKNGFYRVVGKDKGASGWVRGTDIQISKKPILIGFQAAAACATVLDECTEDGCAEAGSADGVSNALKHHIPTSSSPRVLSFEDLAALQQSAGDTVGTGKHVPPEARSALDAISISGGKVSEGDSVRVIGYLTIDGTGPHPNASGESVNCGLTGSKNNDFHIPVTADPNSSEFEAIVVEMIPQQRPANWTVGKLNKVRSKKQQVWIEGNLFYDSFHRVNADPDNPIGGQPKRFSLWEVHPVTRFLVCEKEVCSDTDDREWSELH